MIEVKFYHTNSPNNKLGKTLNDENTMSCAFKGNCDILNPVIVVKSANYFNYNYAYIEQFKRYYFINDIVILPNNVYTLSLHVDVLETYKNEILASQCDILEQKNFDKDYNSNYQNLETFETETFDSDTEIELTNSENFVLVTLGG